MKPTDLQPLIEARVNELHPKLLIAFLDKLEEVMNTIVISPDVCSYGAYQPFYVHYKLLIRHISRLFERGFAKDSDAEVTQLELRKAQQVGARYHSNMYSNVCFNCVVCKNRVKPWPKSVHKS